MNISKNILSLGLIAVISGISTAQTYTATAGTNGVTDIQSDYSMSTGDGASVSVDVPLEFELPKKVVLALKNADGSFTSNPVFQGFSPNFTTQSSFIFNGIPWSGDTDMSSQFFQITTGIYSNADNITITGSGMEGFIHENGIESGLIDSNMRHHYYDSSWTGLGNFHEDINKDTPNSNIAFSHSLNFDLTSTTDNIIGYWITRHLELDSINPTDRAGKYLSTQTITVTVL